MKPIEINNSYFIDTTGRLFNSKSGTYLKGSMKDSGYLMYCVRSPFSSQPKYPTAHVLVAKAFIPNPENKPQVNHKDGNKLNNNVDNLEWVTAKENLEHAKNVLGKKIYFQIGVKHHNAKLNKEKVRKIRKEYKKGNTTFRTLAEKYSVSSLVINQVIHNRTWKNI